MLDREPFRIEDFSALQSRLLWCYEGVVAETDRSKENRENHSSAWLLLRGRATLNEGKRIWKAGAGQWLFGGPRARHQDFSRDASILSINFRLEWPSGDSLFSQPLVVPAAEHPALSRTARSLARFVGHHFPGVRTNLWKCGADLVLFFEMQQLFSSWIAAYLRAMSASGTLPGRAPGLDGRVLAVLRKLDQYSWTSSPPLSQLAREAGLATRHLDRLFSQQVGLTPRAYLQKCRRETAMALLKDSTAPIKQIAYQLGFSSPGHFSGWFRQITSQSPRAYRAARNAATR